MQTELTAWLAGLGAAPERLLLLDYDGTLAPFSMRRMQSRPYRGVSAALEAIVASGRTRLTLVSGRELSELARVFPLAARVECWGCHGLTRQRPGQAEQRAELHPLVELGLSSAADYVRALGFERMLEHKYGSLALHWRGLKPLRREMLQSSVPPLWAGLASGQLELLEFDGGLELKQRAVNKGTVVTALLAECPPRTAAAYLGDDFADEAAFGAIAGRGLGLLVCAAERPSAAGYRLQPPDELLEFLHAWQRAQADGREVAAHG